MRTGAVLKWLDYVSLRSGLFDWRDRGTAFDDGAGSSELGCAAGMAAFRKHVARIFGVCVHALHSHRAGAGGIGGR